MRQKPWLTYTIDFFLYDFPKFEEQKYILFFAKFDLLFKGSTSGLKSPIRSNGSSLTGDPRGSL